MISRRRFLVSGAAAAPALALAAQTKAPSSHSQSAAPECPDTALPAPILALTDRTHEIHPITTNEREGRLDRARELMAANKLDAILITTGASMLYFTGAHWGQSERLFAYVIPQSAAAFVICPYLERDHLSEALATFPARETTLTYLWNENDSPYTALRRALAECNITTGTLGLEEHTQFAFANGIAQACPALKIVSATPVTAGCRMIKSAAEIALMRLANHITLNVYRAAFLSCGPGKTNHDFTALVDRAYGRCGVHGDASCNVGINSAVPHGSAAPQTIREGDMVLIDDGCIVDGYQSDISRSFVYGTPTDEQRKVFDIVRNAQSAALAAARPGVAAETIDTAARSVILNAGFGPGYDFFNHRVGHGIGLDMHEWPYLVQGNTEELEANMTFSNEPGIYIRGKFGVRLEDDMVITDDGAQLFTPQSASLTDPFPSKPSAIR